MVVEIAFGYARKKGAAKIPEVRLVSQEQDAGLGKQLRLVPSGAEEFTVGLGKEAEIDAETIRRAAGKAVTHLQAVLLESELALSSASCKKALSRESAAAFAEGAILASYSFQKYKTGPEKESSVLEKLHLPVAKSQEILDAKTVADGTNWVREIQNEPANVATPSMLAALASREAKALGISSRVYSKAELERMGFGAMLAVARGSAEEPKLIVLEYRPKSGVAKRKVAVVGKGVCFDSGGISIKPSRDMDQMKFDKSGGVAAIGIARLAALMNLPVHLVAVVPAVENLPSGTAGKPGDIVKAYNGKTIEILDTDAEGRLILSDALAFTCKEFKPDILVDLATLTGACVVALGDVAAGLFSNDPELAKSLFDAGLASGERLWELPLMWKDYDEKIKSDVADVKNLGQSGQAGATAGASFLKEFVPEGPRWAHLDIAGTAWTTTAKPYLSKGATGFGVRVLARYLRGMPSR